MFKRSNMVVFYFLGIKTSAFTACVLSNLLRNRTVKELYFLLIQCLFLLLFCCPLRVFRQSMCAAKADTCVRIPTHKALQTHQFRQCRARADKAAIAFPYGKDFLFACYVKLTAKPYHERNILFVTPILAPAYPWTATFFRNRMLSLFRYLRQLTLYRHRNATCRLRLLLLFGLIWKTVFPLLFCLACCPNFDKSENSDMAITLSE